MTNCPGCRVELPPDAGRACPMCFARLDRQSPPALTRRDRLAAVQGIGGMAFLLLGILSAVFESAVVGFIVSAAGAGLLIGAYYCLPRVRGG